MTDVKAGQKPKQKSKSAKTFVSVYVDGRPDLAKLTIDHLQKGTSEKGVRFIVTADRCDSYTLDRLREFIGKAGDRWSLDEVQVGSRVEVHRLVGQRALESGCREIALVDGDVLLPSGWLTKMRDAKSLSGAAVLFPLSNMLLSGSIALAEKDRIPHALKGFSWSEACEALASKFSEAQSFPEAYLCDISCCFTSPEFFMGATPPDEGLATGVFLEEHLDEDDMSAVVESVYAYHFGASASDNPAIAKMEMHDLYLRSPGLQIVTKKRQSLWGSRCSEYSSIKANNTQTKGVCFTSQYLDHYGGLTSVVDLANRLTLRGMNVEMAYVSNEHSKHDILARGIKFRNRRSLIGRSDKACLGGGINVATHWTSGPLVTGACQANEQLLPVAYWQDREDKSIRFGGMQLVSPPDSKEYTSILQKVCASSYVKNSAEQELTLAGFRKIQTGVDTDLFYPPEARDEARAVRILVLSRSFIEHKGAKRIHDLFSFLREKHSTSVSLEVFGEDIKAETLDKSHRRLTRAALAKTLRAVDIVVSLSDSEGVCSLGLEAMASGAAFVSLKNGGVEEYATDENCILTDEDSIKDAVSMLVEKPELRRQLGVAGRETALEFNMDRQADEWQSFITLVLNPPKKPKVKPAPKEDTEPPKEAEPLHD